MTNRLTLTILLLAFLVPGSVSAARDKVKVARYDESAPAAFVPKGAWMVGGNASYSGHRNENYTFMVASGINSVGFHLAVSPEVLYFVGDNLGVGAKFSYGRMMLDAQSAKAELGSLALTVDNYYAISHDFTAMLMLRYYIPIADSKRVAFHIDAGAMARFGQAEQSDEHTGAVVGTWEKNHKMGILVNPGLTARLSPRVSLFATVGMAGITYGKKQQVHNQVATGSSKSFSLSYMVDLTSLSIGFDIMLGKR
ncbi:MAG: hypothetical protein K5910_05140 [Bacteroidales bacterium]|nr:hypothetical protein [Bacteroidales bacterium]